MGLKLLKDYLEKRNVQQAQNLDDKTIFYVFRKVIKEEFGNVGAAKLVPDFYKHKTIFVKSESSAWASELWLNKDRVVRQMNKELGEGSVEKIHVK